MREFSRKTFHPHAVRVRPTKPGRPKSTAYNPETGDDPGFT